MGRIDEVLVRLKRGAEDATTADAILIREAATLITSLRDALEPFAQAAEAIPDTNASDNQVHYSPARLTVADFRRARALNPSRKETI